VNIKQLPVIKYQLIALNLIRSSLGVYPESHLLALRSYLEASCTGAAIPNSWFRSRFLGIPYSIPPPRQGNANANARPTPDTVHDRCLLQCQISYTATRGTCAPRHRPQPATSPLFRITRGTIVQQ
jgi:hypothetical protein